MKTFIAGVLTAGAVALGAAAPAYAISTGASAYDGVCALLKEHNSADGVVLVILDLKSRGYSDKQVVNLIVGSVKTVCPQYKAAVLAFVDKYGE